MMRQMEIKEQKDAQEIRPIHGLVILVVAAGLAFLTGLAIGLQRSNAVARDCQEVLDAVLATAEPPPMDRKNITIVMPGELDADSQVILAGHLLNMAMADMQGLEDEMEEGMEEDADARP